MMRPFLLVRREINSWPRHLFAGNIRFNRLSLELTKKCTNKCDHCANYGDPKDSRMMDTQLVFRLIRKAKEQGIETIHLWGGEPFLHPNLNAIIAEVFKNNLNLMITSNGFWGTTVAEVAAKLSGINKMKPEDLYFQLIISCDGFHQSQPATPIDKVANVLKGVMGIDSDHFIALVHSCNIANDNTLESLFPLLKPQIVPNAIKLQKLKEGETVTFYHKGKQPVISMVNGPIDLSVGKAKELSPEIRGTKPLGKDEVYNNRDPILRDILYVDVEGEVFLDSHNIGDRNFPIGNIHSASLRNIMDKVNSDLMVRALYTMPFKYFLFPFRKYLDLDPLLRQSHSVYELFNRLYLAEATQDKRDELDHARDQMQQGALSRDELQRMLLPIRLYGDITDREALEQFFKDASLAKNDRWEAAFVFLALSTDGAGLFAYSGHRAGGFFGSNPFAPFIQFYHGKGKIEDMGSQQFPLWHENYNY